MTRYSLWSFRFIYFIVFAAFRQNYTVIVLVVGPFATEYRQVQTYIFLKRIITSYICSAANYFSLSVRHVRFVGDGNYIVGPTVAIRLSVLTGLEQRRFVADGRFSLGFWPHCQLVPRHHPYRSNWLTDTL